MRPVYPYNGKPIPNNDLRGHSLHLFYGIRLLHRQIPEWEPGGKWGSTHEDAARICRSLKEALEVKNLWWDQLTNGEFSHTELGPYLENKDDEGAASALMARLKECWNREETPA